MLGVPRLHLRSKSQENQRLGYLRASFSLATIAGFSLNSAATVFASSSPPMGSISSFDFFASTLKSGSFNVSMKALRTIFGCAGRQHIEAVHRGGVVGP